MDFIIFKQLGVALILSSLIGLEREHKYQLYKVENSFGGVRTFALIGIIGCLSYILSTYSIWFFVLFTLGFFGLLISSYWLVAKVNKSIGATSDIAAILVYMVGIFSAMGEFGLATIIALMTLTILHFKKPLHVWAKQLKNEEIVSTIEFIIIAFVILPLLPDKDFGPYGFFNPYNAWFMVVLISGISYMSYIAIKIFGAKRGIVFSGFLAGFISSTALVLSFLSVSKKNKKVVNPYVLAVVVASSAMFFRVLLEVSVLSPSLFKNLVIPMGIMGLTGLVSTVFFITKKEKLSRNMEKGLSEVKSPFNIGPAIQFGLFFALVSFITKFGVAYMGDKGLYLTSVISGLFDVDAITVRMAKDFSAGDLSAVAAVTAISIGAVTNTVMKGGIFMIWGNRKAGLKILAVFGAMLLLGGIALAFIY